jgi:hypothetical protein
LRSLFPQLNRFELTAELINDDRLHWPCAFNLERNWSEQ